MANLKISELLASDVLVGDEILPLVQDGVTKKVTVSQIVDNVDSYTKSEADTLLLNKVDKVTGSSLVEDTKVTAYDNHIADTSNPHSVTASQVGAYTTAQTDTALGLKVDKVTGSSLVDDTKVTSYDNHLSNTSNPHGVTASQVGAYTTAQADTLLNAKEDTANKGVPNGYASLDLNGKVPLTQISDSILGQLEYMGVWDFATLPTATQKGQYWVASGSGNGYEVGDWAVYNGTTFDKVDNTDAVSSVAGRTGNVVLTKDDVGLNNVTNEAQEVLTNKKTDIEVNKTSNTFFPTIKAVYDWAKGLFVEKNTAITGATKTKITYDSKGLVTAGADLIESDIPALSISKTTGLQTALDSKLPVGGTAVKVQKLTASDVSNPMLNGGDNTTENTVGYVRDMTILGQSDGALYSQAHSSAWQHQIYGDYRTGRIAIRGKNNGTWQPWREVLDSVKPIISGQVGAQTSVTVGLIPFNEIWVNIGGISYNATTRRFTVPQTGTYRITMNPFKSQVSATARVLIGINTDTPTITTHRGHAYASGSIYSTMSINSVVNLSANDYIVFRLQEGTLYNESSDKFNQFTIERIA